MTLHHASGNIRAEGLARNFPRRLGRNRDDVERFAITGQGFYISNSLELDRPAVILCQQLRPYLGSDKLVHGDVMSNIKAKPVESQMDLVQADDDVVILDEAPINLRRDSLRPDPPV